jgi:hypothetical protein
LLLLDEIEEPPRRLSVRLCHSTILQLYCCIVTNNFGGRSEDLAEQLRPRSHIRSVPFP